MNISQTLRNAGAAALLGVIALTGTTQAADYPDHVITGIIPFDPGGPSDVLSRIVATGLAKELGQNIVMQNRPGAAGNIGIAVVAKSKADGYTLLFCSIATTENPATFRNLPYDPLKDIIGVAQFAQSPAIISVNAAQVPATTLQDFFTYARANPGKLNLAAGGGGQRISVNRFLIENNLKMEIVTYNSGGEAATALAGGEAQVRLSDGASVGPGYGQGKIKLLAVAGDTRLKAYAEVPTTKELGLPYRQQNHIGLYAPAGVPADIVNKINAAVNKVLQTPEVAEKFLSLGNTPVNKTAKEFDDFYRNEVIHIREVAKAANIPTVD